MAAKTVPLLCAIYIFYVLFSSLGMLLWDLIHLKKLGKDCLLMAINLKEKHYQLSLQLMSHHLHSVCATCRDVLILEGIDPYLYSAK